MGWLGFLAVVPWIQAFIWALRPTYVVDIRDMPQARRRDTDEEIARLNGKPIPETASVLLGQRTE